MTERGWEEEEEGFLRLEDVHRSYAEILYHIVALVPFPNSSVEAEP